MRTAFIAVAGFALLAACGGNDATTAEETTYEEQIEERADAVDEWGEQQAETIEEQTDQAAEVLEERAEAVDDGEPSEVVE